MKCFRDGHEVDADDCEECVSARNSIPWCRSHIIWGAMGEPRFSHPFGFYNETSFPCQVVPNITKNQKLSKECEEWKSKAIKWSTRIVELQELLARGK